MPWPSLAFSAMASKIAYHYQLDNCLDWIIKNGFNRIILQFKQSDIGDSVEVLTQLGETYRTRTNQQAPLDLYVTQSNTCCVDLIVTQHVSNVDAIIHFGRVCLSKPHLVNQDREPPVLFAFTRPIQEPENFDSNVEKIIDHIQSIVAVNSNCPICLLYDTDLIDYAQNISDALRAKALENSVEVAKLIVPSNWTTTASDSLVCDRSNHQMGHFGLSKSVDSYKSAVYLGVNSTNNLVLQMPSNAWKIDCLAEFAIEQLNVTRVLNKRMALVDRLRDDEELKFGVIITNPLPDIGEIVTRLTSCARARRHILYFITMIQTIDECKIGNFDLCDAFVVINNCTCSTILESLYFNRPIISDLEFKLACGFEAVYGRVLWPKSDAHPFEEDLINKRKVSDISLALVHDRNELLERCSTARVNLWSGLDFKTPERCESGGDGHEGLSIEEGLNGIASTYVSEPLKKSTRDDEQ